MLKPMVDSVAVAIGDGMNPESTSKSRPEAAIAILRPPLLQ